MEIASSLRMLVCSQISLHEAQQHIAYNRSPHYTAWNGMHADKRTQAKRARLPLLIVKYVKYYSPIPPTYIHRRSTYLMVMVGTPPSSAFRPTRISRMVSDQ